MIRILLSAFITLVILSCSTTQPKPEYSNLTQSIITNEYAISGDYIKELHFEKGSLNTAATKEIQLHYFLAKAGEVSIDIVDEDGFKVRALIKNKKQMQGAHSELWNGKDDNGTSVPDEAYFPIITYTGETTEILNPLTLNGGIDIEGKNIQYDANSQTISYQLEKPARTIVRIGLEKSALLNSLSPFKPKLAGNVTEFWTGTDADNIQNIIQENVPYSMAAFGYTLPQPCVITYGNRDITYKEYKKNIDTLKLKRHLPDSTYMNTHRISMHYKQTRYYDNVPNIKMTFPHNREKDDQGRVTLQGKVLVKVEIEKGDVQYFDDQYEITFFVDNTFYAEEEIGYMPYNWLWKLRDIEPGEHILTVNISSFKDRIGVKSMKIFVEK